VSGESTTSDFALRSVVSRRAVDSSSTRFWLERRVALGAGMALLCGALSACGAAVDTALQTAVAHPYSIGAARYAQIHLSDLPHGYSARSAAARTKSEDAAQTLAEYGCEHLSPPSQPVPISERTPDFVDPAGTTEVHETTAIFASASSASGLLDLELNPRYPSCKAVAFRRVLVADAPKGERIGFVTVRVTHLSSRFGDPGVQVVGLSTLVLPGGVATLATSDLVVLIRGRLVAELSIDTDGSAPTALVNQLTSDLASRLARVVPSQEHN
jgi:hypothetical protein